MSAVTQPAPSTRIWRIFAAIGALIVLVTTAVDALTSPAPDPLRPFLLIALLAITPLSLGLMLGTSRLERAFPLLYIPAAVLGSISLYLKPGTLAGLLAFSWLAFTVRLILLALIRIRDHRFNSIAEWAITAGLLYTPIGAGWLVASRLGINPLGFSAATITLTAIHFHTIPLGAQILTGLTGRRAPSTLYRLTAAAMIVSPLLVALGITLSTLIEVIGALILVVAALLLASITLIHIVPHARTPAARALFIISSLSVFAAMLLAAAYALSRAGAPISISIPEMARIHGWLNSVGFVLAGLLAWHLEENQ